MDGRGRVGGKWLEGKVGYADGEKLAKQRPKRINGIERINGIDGIDGIDGIERIITGTQLLLEKPEKQGTARRGAGRFVESGTITQFGSAYLTHVS